MVKELIANIQNFEKKGERNDLEICWIGTFLQNLALICFTVSGKTGLIVRWTDDRRCFRRTKNIKSLVQYSWYWRIYRKRVWNSHGRRIYLHFTVCPWGKFWNQTVSDCTEECHCVDGNGTCDPLTGICPSGCAYGWTGEHCNQCADFFSGDECEGKSHMAYDTRIIYYYKHTMYLTGLEKQMWRDRS